MAVEVHGSFYHVLMTIRTARYGSVLRIALAEICQTVRKSRSRRMLMLSQALEENLKPNESLISQIWT